MPCFSQNIAMSLVSRKRGSIQVFSFFFWCYLPQILLWSLPRVVWHTSWSRNEWQVSACSAKNSCKKQKIKQTVVLGVCKPTRQPKAGESFCWSSFAPGYYEQATIRHWFRKPMPKIHVSGAPCFFCPQTNEVLLGASPLTWWRSVPFCDAGWSCRTECIVQPEDRQFW